MDRQPIGRVPGRTALAPPPSGNSPDQINREFDIGIFEAWALAPGRPENPYGRVRITYRASALSVNLIAGTRIPLAGTTATWRASATGGVLPYRFQWLRDGVPVGTDSLYTASAGTTDFELRVEITDAGGNTRAAAALIDVDGVLSSLAAARCTPARAESGAHRGRVDTRRTPSSGTSRTAGSTSSGRAPGRRWKAISETGSASFGSG